MTTKTVDKLLNQVNNIGQVAFTGGEPTLNSELILYFIDEVVKRGITVDSFYMVTNGRSFNRDLFLRLVEFYGYCGEPEMCAVAISYDEFHTWGPEYKYEAMWKTLSFYSDGHDQRENKGFVRNVIREGNASINGIGNRTLGINKLYASDGVFYEEFYVNANGEINYDCDMSYKTQESNILGTVDDIETVYSENVNEEAA